MTTNINTDKAYEQALRDLAFFEKMFKPAVSSIDEYGPRFKRIRHALNMLREQLDK